MFGRKRSKLNNATAGVLPPVERKTTINNQAPNYAALLVVAGAMFVVFVFLGWRVLVYLFGEIGYSRPERVAAGLVLWGSIIILSLILASQFILSIVERWLETKVRLAETNGEWEYKQQMARRQLVADRSTMGEDVRFVALIEAVMFEAYSYVEKNGQYTANDAKPWAREQAKKVVLSGEREPVGWTMGVKVRRWLTEHSIIKRDEINLARFPDFASVQAELRQHFAAPIQINPPQNWDISGWQFHQK